MRNATCLRTSKLLRKEKKKERKKERKKKEGCDHVMDDLLYEYIYANVKAQREDIYPSSPLLSSIKQNKTKQRK